MKYGSRLSTVFLAMAALLVLSMAALHAMGRGSLARGQAVVRLQHEILQIQETLSTLKDAETGQRGFVITGIDGYLEPYRSASARIHDELEELRQLARTGQLR